MTAETKNLPAMHSGGRIAPIVPATWPEVVQIAGAICRANMAPKSYLDKQGNPITDKVAVAIMHGLEVGFTPMAALQSIAVINGMPAIYGDGLLALIRASGLLEDIEETIEWGKGGPVSATCKMWRKGEKTPSVQTYTRADAENARLWGKVGPWSDHPARMLQWRARGWCGRDKFADVLRGLRSAEEVTDMVDVTPQGAATVTEPKRDDPKYQSTPDATPHGAPAESGQPVNSPPTGAGGDSKPEAASAPANTEQTRVTDVEDQNAKVLPPEQAAPGEQLTFQRYTKVVAFIDFSDHFLPRTNAEGAAQFEAFYENVLAGMEKGKPATQEAAAHIRKLLADFRASGREPGEEG